MQYVHLDFETQSCCDLKKAGAWRYAEDPTTSVICLVYETNGTVYRWYPPGGLCEPLHLLATDPEVVFVAHNAMFEQAIWHYHMVGLYGFPEIPVERWEDTLATCAWKSLPLALDKAGRALNVPMEKDKEGNALTLSMSRFDKRTGNLPVLTPEKLDRIGEYCAKDVEVEKGIEKQIGLLSVQSKHERGIWIMDQRINQRGVRLDMPFVQAAAEVVERSTVPLTQEFRELTGGLNPGQRDKVLAWIRGQGVEIENLQKGTLEELLEDGEQTDEAGYESLAEDDLIGPVAEISLRVVPPLVRRVLEIRQLLGSASIKKLARMLACVGYDARARGLLQYHAAGTGRWGGRLLQPQNFPRGDDELRQRASIDAIVDAIMTGDPEYVEMVLGLPAIEAVAHALRFALVPDDGKVFLVGDYAGIEMRIDLAMAGQYDKCDMLAAGHDVYLDMACDIFNKPRGSLNKDEHVFERTIGKNTVLGCGFQMGANTFHSRYCQDQSLEFAEGVVRAYRTQWAPKVPELWYTLQDAALRAAQGTPTEAYGVRYQIEGAFLTARLPSRWQKLWYYQPRLGVDPRFNHDDWTCLTAKNGKMVKRAMYGGLLTENAVQATARGLLCGAMQRLEQAGMPVVLTVHDEIVCEVDAGTADLGRFKALMEERSPWAEAMQIPVSVEVPKEGPITRYRK